MATDTLESLLAKLHTQEALIECLFLTVGTTSPPKPPETDQVQLELNVLRNFVSQIPHMYYDLILQWRNKMAIFWNRLQIALTSEFISRIQEKLLCLECTLEKMFTIDPLPAVLIKEKLHEMEDQLSYLHGEHLHLATTWREKVANLWMQFCANVDEQQTVQRQLTNGGDGADINWQPLVEITSNESANNVATEDNLEDDGASSHPNFENIWHEAQYLAAASTGSLLNSSGTSVDHNCQQLEVDTNEQQVASSVGECGDDGAETLPSEPSVQTESAASSSLLETEQKEAIRREMVEIFSTLQISCGDSNDLTRLMDAIAKAGKRIMTCRCNTNELKTVLFKLAYEKLTAQKRKQFQNFFGGHGFPLSNLIRMILIDIVGHQRQAQTQQPSSDPTLANIGGFHRRGRNCIVCMTRGHQSNDCPHLSKMLCCKCFNYGHFGTHCPEHKRNGSC